MKRLMLATIIGIAVAVVAWHSASETRAVTADKAAMAPVESSMHEFMEYVFQPTYKRLKVNMASAPSDNQGWKAIKSDALILAEASNLILLRTAGKNQADWNAHGVQSREYGGQLYRAAKAKDFAAAKKLYAQMLNQCNACHKQFATGKYQLAP